MPLFICENCGTIDNTATGFYWSRKFIKFKDSKFNGKALCCECVPDTYDDGSKRRKSGKWHNHFPKEKYDPLEHKDWHIINK